VQRVDFGGGVNCKQRGVTAAGLRWVTVSRGHFRVLEMHFGLIRVGRSELQIELTRSELSSIIHYPLRSLLHDSTATRRYA
jgi:hypothetical protein